MNNNEITPGPISNAHYCALGKVAANWAALEAMINSAIWQIGEIPDEIGACITSQIFTYDAKLKALVSLLGVRGGLVKTIAELNKFHEDTRGIAQSRNRAMHDPWVGDLGTGTPHRLQISADKNLVSGYKAVLTGDLNALVDKIADMINRFEAIIQPVIARFPLLPKKSPQSPAAPT